MNTISAADVELVKKHMGYGPGLPSWVFMAAMGEQRVDVLAVLAEIKSGNRPHEALPNESGLGGQEEPLPSLTQKEAGE